VKEVADVRKPDPRTLPQSRQKHPAPWEHDLNPHHLEGQNIGVAASAHYAADVKLLTRTLDGFTLDELRQIPVLLPGARLEQGGTYLDVTDPKRPVYNTTAEWHVPWGHYFVPKAGVHYELWNRLKMPVD
jgi:hypothetical protein